MGRLTNDDKHFGPITYGRVSWNPIRLVWSSGGGEDNGRVQNTLTAYALGHAAQIILPNILQPFKVKHHAPSWDAATIARLGRDWYFDVYPREYGFSVSDGFLQIFLGAQTHDSDTEQRWSAFLPWTQWRFVRRSLYDLQGQHFWTEPTSRIVPTEPIWYECERMIKEVPKMVFEVEDCDGTSTKATTFIEEREWRFGEGWFKWLSRFNSPKIRRELSIEFAKEIGPGKGSWKGGVVSCGTDILPGELHEAAFRRFCDSEQQSRHRPYKITFVGCVTENMEGNT